MGVSFKELLEQFVLVNNLVIDGLRNADDVSAVLQAIIKGSSKGCRQMPLRDEDGYFGKIFKQITMIVRGVVAKRLNPVAVIVALQNVFNVKTEKEDIKKAPRKMKRAWNMFLFLMTPISRMRPPFEENIRKRMADSGIEFLIDLMILSEEQIAKAGVISVEERIILNAQLARFGLSFGVGKEYEHFFMLAKSWWKEQLEKKEQEKDILYQKKALLEKEIEKLTIIKYSNSDALMLCKSCGSHFYYHNPIKDVCCDLLFCEECRKKRKFSSSKGKGIGTPYPATPNSEANYNGGESRLDDNVL